MQYFFFHDISTMQTTFNHFNVYKRDKIKHYHRFVDHKKIESNKADKYTEVLNSCFMYVQKYSIHTQFVTRAGILQI